MKRTVLVIGGGPAGLTAALRLNSAGFQVTLLEQSGKPGGRLETAPLVILGYQRATRSLLDCLGTSRLLGSFSRSHYDFRFANGACARLRRPWLPGPLHTLLGLALFKGLSYRDRWLALTLIERTWEKDPPLPSDLDARTADEWLTEHGQSELARRRVWSPLSRFLVGGELPRISAALLARMLTRCFLTSRHNSALAIPAHSLTALLAGPATEQLTRSGATVRLHSHVTQLEFSRDRILGVTLAGGEKLKADWYVLAVPRKTLCSLLPDRVLTHYAYFEQLSQLTESPAVVVHFWIKHAQSASRLVLLSERPFHWIVQGFQQESGQNGARVSCVATGTQDMLDRPDSDLVHTALADLKIGCPELSAATVHDQQIVRETQAFLSPRPGTATLRPLPHGPIANLLLAGAWTDTGLPSTLESAILSGDQCASVITAAEPSF